MLLRGQDQTHTLPSLVATPDSRVLGRVGKHKGSIETMEFNVTTSGPARQRSDCLIVSVSGVRRLGLAAKQLDKTSSGRLSELIRKSRFSAKVGNTLMLHSVRGVSADRVLVVGCGKSPVTAGSYRRILRAALDAANSAGARKVTSYLSEVTVLDRDAAWAIRQAVESGHETTYRFDSCKGEAATVTPPDLRKLTVAVDADGLAAASAAVRTGDGIGTGVRLAKDLGNLPGNVCTPSYLAEQAKRLAARHASLKATIYDEKQMASMKMGSLLSVAQGSTEPPRLIVLEHKAGEASAPPTVLVGKGVTFDSGGISIKPSAAMDEMKFDMCGAASVLGTLAAAAELELPLNVVGIIPATENLPGNNATKPGDIFTSMSGQTIEVLNTDAEGRLILCDALTFASRFKPDTVIDIATLTGACVIALGAHASGLFDNDDDLAGALLAAGESSGDRAWRMPVWEEYGEALKSNFADVANVGGREAGAITAAAFLARFAREYRWAHLDIAGTAWRSGRRKGSTGRPVPLLTQFLLDKIPT